jgi:hypothetical protein
MARKVKQIHQIEIRAKIGKRKASIHEVDLVSLASTADALSADGRNDLASFIIEVLYYCAERQVDSPADSGTRPFGDGAAVWLYPRSFVPAAQVSVRS